MGTIEPAYSPRTGERLLFFKKKGKDFLFRQAFRSGGMTGQYYVMGGVMIAAMLALIIIIPMMIMKSNTRWDYRMICPVIMAGLVIFIFFLMSILMLKRIFGAIRIKPHTQTFILGTMVIFNKKFSFQEIEKIKCEFKPHGKYHRLRPTVLLVIKGKRDYYVFVDTEQELASSFAKELSEIMNIYLEDFESDKNKN